MKKIVALFILAAILMSFPVSAEETDKTVPLYVSPTVPTVTVDGRVTEEEWGKPDAVFTPKDFEDRPGWALWDLIDYPYIDEQSMELYARRDDKNLYFAFRFVNVHHIDTAYTDTNGWRHPGMRLAIGTYDEQTVITNLEKGYGETYENWYYCNLRPKYDPDRGVFYRTHANGVNCIAESRFYDPNAAIFVNEDDLSYEYEIVLPYADLHGVVTAESENIVLSFEMTDALTDGLPETKGANRWFVSEAVRLAVEKNDPEAFLNYYPLRLIYEEAPIPEPEPEIEEPVVPMGEEEREQETTSFPWVILPIAGGVVVVGIGIVIGIKKLARREKRK